jgi:hypothetical protein
MLPGGTRHPPRCPAALRTRHIGGWSLNRPGQSGDPETPGAIYPRLTGASALARHLAASVREKRIFGALSRDHQLTGNLKAPASSRMTTGRVPAGSNIDASRGILTHAIPAWPTIAVEHFGSFWQEIRSPIIYMLVSGPASRLARSDRPIMSLFPLACARTDEWRKRRMGPRDDDQGEGFGRPGARRESPVAGGHDAERGVIGDPAHA